MELRELPKVSHRSLLSRDLECRKPFRDGRGYRDALIWETILELLREGEAVVFVTEEGDFTDNGERLDPTLQEEVNQIGATNRFDWCSSLTDVVIPEERAVELAEHEVDTIRQIAYETVVQRLTTTDRWKTGDALGFGSPAHEVELAEPPHVRVDRRRDEHTVDAVVIVKVIVWGYGSSERVDDRGTQARFRSFLREAELANRRYGVYCPRRSQ